MPKKTLDEFKSAFKAIKKPSRPKNVSGKIKSDLEKAVTGDDETAFVAKIDELAKLDHQYLVKLVAYKLGKHFENDSKMPFWHKKVPTGVLGAALAQIVPGDMTDPQTKRLMDQSVASGDIARVGLLLERDANGTLDYFRNLGNAEIKKLTEQAIEAGAAPVVVALVGRRYERDPDGTMKYLLDSKEEAIRLKNEARDKSNQAHLNDNTAEYEKQNKIYNEQNQREVQINGALVGVLGPDHATLTAKYLLRANTDDSIRKLIPMIGSLPDVLEVAREDPEHFIEDVLSQLDTGTRLKLLSDPKLRSDLRAAAKDQWDAFAQQVPILRLYHTVEEARKNVPKSDDPKKEQHKDIAAIFDSIMDGDDVAAAYVGTKTGNPSEIMAKFGPPDTDNPPRTDCHNMLMVLNATIKGYPGMVPGLGDQLKWGHCTNMLMTKKLGEIGVTGRGLIDKSFTGNVFDDSGKATGRILFTGESGVNSHSWLEVDGVAYDPVLGISGKVKDVETASTFMKFDWTVTDLVGAGADGWYFIKDDPSIIKPEKKRLKVASNPMSFNIAYYLTKTPAQLLKPADDLRKLGWSQDVISELVPDAS